MQILRTIREMREARREAAAAQGLLGLVPTMGALHVGHLSLVRAAKAECAVVAASIFVNPAQFGPNEDFSRYPRTFDDDTAQLEAEGVDLLFAPAAEEMYPRGPRTLIEVDGIGDRLDGVSRPGHFRGVATVVAKLFHIVAPDRAYFGQKDAAQVAVLRAMIEDLNFPLKLVVCPTVRDADGLALSSRNRYLSAEEREQALAIPRALLQIPAELSLLQLRGWLRDKLEDAPGLRLEYAEVVDPRTLESVTDLHSGALVAVAAHVGRTRLIDNVVLEGKR